MTSSNFEIAIALGLVLGQLLIVPARAQANEPCSVIRLSESLFKSPYVHPSLSNLEMRHGGPERGFILIGNIDGEGPVRLGEIWPHFSEQPYEYTIKEIYVSSKARKKGVAATLYDFLIRQAESDRGVRITRLKGTGKTGTNLNTFLNRLMANLKAKPGFIPPTRASHGLQAKALECCAALAQQYPDAVEAAVRETPTFHIGKRLGFDLCPKSLSLSFSKDTHGVARVDLNFDMCR